MKITIDLNTRGAEFQEDWEGATTRTMERITAMVASGEIWTDAKILGINGHTVATVTTTD